MIPYGVTFAAHHRDITTKQVKCEACGGLYGYLMLREAEGKAFSFLGLDNDEANRLAAERARLRVRQALEREVDPLPCPHCGHYQANMLWPARRARYRWAWLKWYPLVVFGMFALLVGGTSLLPERGLGGRFDVSREPFAVPVSLVCVGVLLLPVTYRAILRWDYNPNKEPLEDRLALGRAKALVNTPSPGQLSSTSAPAESPQPPSTITPDLPR